MGCTQSQQSGVSEPAEVGANVIVDGALPTLLTASRKPFFSCGKGATPENIKAAAVQRDDGYFEDGWSGTPAALGKINAKSVNGWGRPGRNQGVADNYVRVSFFAGGAPHPNDIIQGSLGDCWLLCTLAVFAEWPDYMRQLASGDDSTRTEYTIKLFDYSTQEFGQVVVDDRVPSGTGSHDGQPAFAQLSRAGATWPTVFEKAFARKSGNYGNIENFYPSFAMGMLTGCTDFDTIIREEDGQYTHGAYTWQSSNPKDDSNKNNFMTTNWPDGTPGYERKDIEDVLKLLQDAADNNYPIAATTYGSWAGVNMPAPRDFSPEGIASGHCYSILQVKTDIAGTGTSLLNMRNPWGQTNFHGPWGNNSDLWDRNPAIKEALDFEPMNDGRFWIEPRDFVVQFPYIDVCRINLGDNLVKREMAAKRALRLAAGIVPC